MHRGRVPVSTSKLIEVPASSRMVGLIITIRKSYFDLVTDNAIDQTQIGHTRVWFFVAFRVWFLHVSLRRYPEFVGTQRGTKLSQARLIEILRAKDSSAGIEDKAKISKNSARSSSQRAGLGIDGFLTPINTCR